MRILVAMDSFKECLTASEATSAVAAGLAGKDVDHCPVADGGEGTASVLGARIDEIVVSGPRSGMRSVVGVHSMPGGGVVIDAAEVLGLALLPPDRRDPERATSRGLGEAIRQLALRGPVTVALGGSSTVDFGVGLAQGLGWRLGGDGDVRVGDLEAVARALPPPAPPGVEVAALCDVRTRLRGADNAIRLYGPQKGATPAQVDRLEGLLERWVTLLEGAGMACGPVLEMAGCGSAGGLGFGLALLADARLIEGARFVLDALDFEARVSRADLVITGEGRFDRTSLEGKITGAVIARARAAGGASVVVVAGSVEPSALRAAGVAGVSLSELAGGTAAAKAEAQRWLAEGARRAVGIAGWR